MDGMWQDPVCSTSLVFQSPHVAISPSSPLPYFDTMSPTVCHCDCDHRHAESVISHLVSESSSIYTIPVPSDAVLVRPRMPLVAGKHEAASPSSAANTTVLLVSSAVHEDHVEGSSREMGISAANVYGGGFYAPPAHSSCLSHTNDEPPVASFSCCPHCGFGFATAAVPQNVVYHPTGPSYVIHSFSPTLQPCYSVTVSSVVARPLLPTAAVPQSSVRLPDSIYQQTFTRPHLPSASLSFNSSPPFSGVRVRTARPPLSCANCGRIGHTQLDCKEPTIDTVLSTRESLYSYTYLCQLLTIITLTKV